MPSQPTVSPGQPLEVCVVSHTHWDREWYHQSPRFRQGLVALVDALLAAPESGPFLLDGQAIVLEDYLRVRPDAAEALRAALGAGRIEAGPWYVLADNLIPSGEAIVRNLEAGRRLLRRIGGKAPPVAYCPDSFGHPAALPMIAQEFGCTTAVVWRGLGGAGHPVADAIRWIAPSAHELLTYHLPPDGYEYGSVLPGDPERARDRWVQFRTLWAGRNRTGVVLLLNGADHHARQPDLLVALERLGEVAGASAHVRHVRLSDWAYRFTASVGTHALPSVQGELRDSYGYTWTLSGTLATRAAQKRRNARLERGLLRDVEPWMALARLRQPAGCPAPVRLDGALSMAQLPALLHRAWEELLATHPHDTLCGCSIDAVARAMTHRQEEVATQAQGIRTAALQSVLGHDPVAARAVAPLTWGALVVRNRTARPRGGVAELRLAETVQDVPVGPGSSAGAVPRDDGSSPSWGRGNPRLQWLSSRTGYARRESPQHYPDNDWVRQHRLLAWLPPVPAFGLHRLDPESLLSTEASAYPSPVQVDITEQRITIAHQGLVVVVRSDGAEPLVELRQADRTVRDALWIESRPDVGDSYTPALRGTAHRLHATRATCLHAGPLRATVRIEWASSRTGRGRGGVRVVTDLQLDAGTDFLTCIIRGHNHRRNHRLQLVWKTALREPSMLADAAFGPVWREPIHPAPNAREAVPAGMPLHRWIAVANEQQGMTLCADGLAEAEVQDGRMALTLLRAIGQLSNGALPERPGHAGWPAPTPEAQSIGPFAARCAIRLHGPLNDAERGRIRDMADDVLLPLVGNSWRDLSPVTHHSSVNGPQLHGEGLEASAVTIAQEDPLAIVLRAVNLTEVPAAGYWELPDVGPWEVTPCRMDETPIAAMRTTNERLPLALPPRGVATLRVRRATAVPAIPHPA